MRQQARADNLTVCYRKKMDVSFSCVCPVIDNEFRHNIVKVVCGRSTRSTATLTMLWRNLWSITRQKLVKTLIEWFGTGKKEKKHYHLSQIWTPTIIWLPIQAVLIQCIKGLKKATIDGFIKAAHKRNKAQPRKWLFRYMNFCEL